jgi:ABC-type amino acid transport system permease subunit
MKFHIMPSKIRLLFFPIIFIGVLLAVIIAAPFARTSVLAQSNAGINVPLCFIETTSGNIIGLERLCGKNQTGATNNLNIPVNSPISLNGGSQIEKNLAWIKQHPSEPVANSPSPYSDQGISDFNKLLYGN